MFKILLLITLTCLFHVKAYPYATENLGATGKVIAIQTPLNHDFIYFKLDNMPDGVIQWFYFHNDEKISAAGCSVKSSKERLERAYSALLLAKASKNNVTLGYCLDANGYGVVNSYFRIDA
jgi:hypothetical protein